MKATRWLLVGVPSPSDQGPGHGWCEAVAAPSMMVLGLPRVQLLGSAAQS